MKNKLKLNPEWFTKTYAEAGGLITETIASELAQKSTSTIERWAEKKKIRGFKHNGRSYISYADLLQKINGKKEKNAILKN